MARARERRGTYRKDAGEEVPEGAFPRLRAMLAAVRAEALDERGVARGRMIDFSLHAFAS
jgi:hypothetical protein